MLRSQDMSLIMLYLNRDIAKQGIQHIGQHPSLHFLNLNTHLKIDQLPFNKEIRFLEKLLARIKFFEDESGKIENVTENKVKAKNLENDINKHYNRLTYLREIRKDTLEKIKSLREDMFVVEDLESYVANTLPDGTENYQMNLDHICFVVSKDKKTMLEGVMYYNLRRNACVYNNDKTIEITEVDKFYNVSGYVIFTHGLNAIEKIITLITSLGGRIITSQSILLGSIGLNDKINQVSRIFENNENAIESELKLIAGKIEYWKYCVNKEMKIYITMNGLGFGKDRDNLVGQGFVLREDIKKIKGLCNYITKKYGYAHIDILKHYTFKKENKSEDFDMHEINYDTTDNESMKISYEVDGSDSDIQLMINSVNEDEQDIIQEQYLVHKDETIQEKELGTSNYTNQTEKNDTNIESDQESIINNDKQANIEEINTDIYKKGDSNNTILDENNCIVNRSEDSVSSRNAQSLFLCKAKSNSTPSIIAVDEEKIQKLELPDYIVLQPETPPTHFHTNKLTKAFQDLNDVYGVPSYKEINPAAFYIVTFPFMFGVMFGDVGHGIMLLLISIYFIRKEKTLKVPDFAEQIFAGRYIMLLCSCWSIFFGFLYSDFIAFPIRLFPSEYKELGGNYIKKDNYTYPFGIDHAWHHKKNAPLYYNSLKMKMSIILGFSHMLLGSILSVLNSRYQNDKLTLYCVVIPQLVAFISFVGYLIFLVVLKWVVEANRQGLISAIVSMFTSPFIVEAPIYPYQKEVQLFLVSNIIISFVWMLFSKPVFETLKIRKTKRLNSTKYNQNDEDAGDELVEVWMHGMIETIEFGIGLVSNTSSYLRLWAISLAHAELTNVLNSMTIATGSLFYKISMFPVWLFFTFVLLIGLEGLSSCLHALRLNWIEFNGKFFKGSGYHFRPLDFKANYDD